MWVWPRQFAHQPRPGFQPRNTTPGEVAVLFHGLRQIGEAPLGGCAKAAIGLLLNLPGDTKHEQTARHPLRRLGAVKPPPFDAQSVVGHTLESPKALSEQIGLSHLARSLSV